MGRPIKTGAFVAWQRHCDHCGTEYTARKLTSRYCSNVCRREGTQYGQTHGKVAPREFGVWRPGGTR